MRKIPSQLKIKVLAAKVLGVHVYRGYARLSDLARISRADIYDQKKNPRGTQRDLNPTHARQAYEYVKTHDLAYWPEIFLCVRDESVIKFSRRKSDADLGTLTVSVLDAGKRICISRVDGNHRLHFADGHSPGMPPIDKVVSFCIAYGLTRDQEITLFRDINNNQRRMNTSHPDTIDAKLTPAEKLKRDDPALYIARKLGRDQSSPLHDRVFEGGKKQGAWSIPLRTLKTGIEYLYSRSLRLAVVPEVDAQYELVTHFLAALQRWEPKAWSEPRRYLMLRGAGLWGACFIGSEVIDRVIGQGKFDRDAMLNVLRSGRSWDWSNDGDFKGFSGRGGAVAIADRVRGQLKSESGVSLEDLAKKILASK